MMHKINHHIGKGLGGWLQAKSCLLLSLPLFLSFYCLSLPFFCRHPFWPPPWSAPGEGTPSSGSCLVTESLGRWGGEQGFATLCGPSAPEGATFGASPSGQVPIPLRKEHGPPKVGIMNCVNARPEAPATMFHYCEGRLLEKVSSQERGTVLTVSNQRDCGKDRSGGCASRAQRRRV